MCWPKRERWKASFALAGLLLLLILMVWVPGSAAGAYESASGLATPGTGTVQATPTTNPTIAAETANEQLRKLQYDNDRSLNAWAWNNGATILSSFLSTLVIVSGALIGFRQWRGNQRAERDKQAEGRFQSAVTGLGDEKEGAKIGAAILLRTFLRPGYEQFHTQTFDLAVAHLRLRRTSPPSEDPDGIAHSPEDPDTPLPLTTLRQALIVVFKEAFPLARSQNKGHPQSLDASTIQLDDAYLSRADLKQVWMPEAFLRNVNLSGANLIRANLSGANLSGASLSRANLSEANLIRASLRGANLSGASLSRAYLRGASLRGTNLSGADLRWVRNFEAVQSWDQTDLSGVKGLSKEQLEACKAKGAIVDEDTTTSPPQSPVSPPAPSQSNDAQAQAPPSAQVNTPSPETGGNGAASPQQGLES